jgi:hypothetical protein
MTSFTFYGGIDEIDGNKMLLGSGGLKIWLVFGQPFNL